MKWNIAGFLAVIAIEVNAAPADACGIKLVVKTPAARRSIARSSNPSHLLLLGTPPHRLQRELAAAGHAVEVAPNASAAQRSSYAVVVVDSKQVIETRAKFPGAVVIVRSGDVVADIASIENQVARKRVRADESRQVVAARAGRRPLAAGPAPSQPVPAPPAAAQAPPAPGPAPAPVAVATTPRAAEPPASVEARPAAARTARPEADRAELYFRVGSAAVDGRHAALDRVARWLTERAGAHVVIEGHADPSGNPDLNLALSQRRAEAVRDYLVAAGIDPSRLEVMSYGDTRLKYGRTDSRNRRVAVQPRR